MQRSIRTVWLTAMLSLCSASTEAQNRDRTSAAWQVCAPPRLDDHIDVRDVNRSIITACSEVIAAASAGDPRLAIAHTFRGVAYGANKDLKKAMADFDAAIALDPKSIEAYFHRGNAHLDQDRNKDAITDYSALLQVDPKDPITLNNRGVAYANLNRMDAAIADWTKAIRIKPAYAEAYANRGDVHLLTNSIEQALADFSEAIRWRPNYQKALAKRGLTLEKLDRPEHAKLDYEAAMRIGLNFGESEEWRDISRDRIAALHKGTSTKVQSTSARTASSAGQDLVDTHQRCGETDGFPGPIGTCLLEAERQHGETLAKLYQRLTTKSGNHSDLVRASQRGWLKYQSDTCALYEKLLSSDGPALARVALAGCLLRTTLQRIDELKTLIEAE
jgi:tetratricopeptide (TPR) repeat protein